MNVIGNKLLINRDEGGNVISYVTAKIRNKLSYEAYLLANKELHMIGTALRSVRYI